MPTFLLKSILMQMRNIESLGQVFTPQQIVADMLSLIQSTKRLENP